MDDSGAGTPAKQHSLHESVLKERNFDNPRLQSGVTAPNKSLSPQRGVTKPSVCRPVGAGLLWRGHYPRLKVIEILSRWDNDFNHRNPVITLRSIPAFVSIPYPLFPIP